MYNDLLIICYFSLYHHVPVQKSPEKLPGQAVQRPVCCSHVLLRHAVSRHSVSHWSPYHPATQAAVRHRKEIIHDVTSQGVKSRTTHRS